MAHCNQCGPRDNDLITGAQECEVCGWTLQLEEAVFGDTDSGPVGDGNIGWGYEDDELALDSFADLPDDFLGFPIYMPCHMCGDQHMPKEMSTEQLLGRQIRLCFKCWQLSSYTDEAMAKQACPG